MGTFRSVRQRHQMSAGLYFYGKRCAINQRQVSIANAISARHQRIAIRSTAEIKKQRSGSWHGATRIQTDPTKDQQVCYDFDN